MYAHDIVSLLPFIGLLYSTITQLLTSKFQYCKVSSGIPWVGKAKVILIHSLHPSCLDLQLRTQGPSELLREHRPTHYTRRLAEKAARKPPEGEDDSRWGRFVVKAKGVASKGKAVSAKYVPGRNKKQDDAIELLPTTNSDEPRRSSALNAARREPPKDLFDDI